MSVKPASQRRRCTPRRRRRASRRRRRAGSSRSASPIAWAPVAHAETAAKLGPRRSQLGGDVAGRRVGQEVRQEVRRHRSGRSPGSPPARSRSACRRRRCRTPRRRGTGRPRARRRSPKPRGRRPATAPCAVHLARLAASEALLGVEPLHLGGDLAGDPRGIEQRHGTKAAGARLERVPRLRDRRSDGRERPDARDDDLMRIHARVMVASRPCCRLPGVSGRPPARPRPVGPRGAGGRRLACLCGAVRARRR